MKIIGYWLVEVQGKRIKARSRERIMDCLRVTFAVM